ncbi:MAG: efflux RND transporter periplasmic adaptor subunit [Desulfobacter sp.]|nr:MAG: efflux RND transporter periplasmic adaptor subunit [Desulfobacter sp.]
MKKNIFAFCLSLLIIYSCDSGSIPPGRSEGSPASQAAMQHTVQVEEQYIARTHAAVGTIRPLTETRIESQVSGQVLSVEVAVSSRVKAGQVLVILDNRQLSARLEQSKEGLAYAKKGLNQARKARDEAKAGLDQAHAAYLRTKTLFDKDVVPSQKLEIDRAGYLQAKARLERAKEGVGAAATGVRRAEEVVREARIGTEYAEIRSPSDGVVVERLIDPGDLAVPGKPLVVIQTSGALRLEARVREGLISEIIQGKTYDVEIQTIGTKARATIEEITPYADPDTRTFLVKAALPDTPGIYPGMFGRLLIPVEKEATLLIPEAALTRVGQLEMVHVKRADKGFESVYVKTGRRFDDKIEILAGLTPKDTIGF